MEIKGQSGTTAPIQGENLALADSCCGNLYDNVYFRGAGQDISSAVNYVSHSQAAKTRLQKSGAWLQSIGKSAYFMESNFQKRVNQVSTGQDPAFDDVLKLPIGDPTHLGTATIKFDAAGGVAAGVNTAFNTLLLGDTLVVKGKEYKINAIASATALTVIPKLPITAATTDAYVLRKVARPANNRSKVFAIWQPPIGIMDHNEALGAGDWRFQLNPNSNYKVAAVESTQGTYNASIVAGTAFDFAILDVKLYIATVKASIPQGISTMYLMESLVQSKPATANTQQYEFTVPSSTRALTVFVQSGKAGSNPLIPSQHV